VPELPEVEVLVRHLKPLLVGKTIQGARVFREKVLLPTTAAQFRETLRGATFSDLIRRGKYLVFELESLNRKRSIKLLGHLGMTGRMYLAKKTDALPKHTAVLIDLGQENFVFEDTRYFGRLTLNLTPLDRLGPEPLQRDFSLNTFSQGLRRSAQPIKVKLLDQSLVAGIGNIYASEALFRAGIAPRLSARRLRLEQTRKLRLAIRAVLRRAINLGSTVPLNHGPDRTDGLFYFGRPADTPDFYEERLQIYDRLGHPCPNCGASIRRIVQAARSTFFCPKCQRS